MTSDAALRARDMVLDAQGGQLRDAGVGLPAATVSGAAQNVLLWRRRPGA